MGPRVQSSALVLPHSPMELLPRRDTPVRPQEEASKILSLTRLAHIVHLMNMTAMTMTMDHLPHRHQMLTVCHHLEAMMLQVQLIRPTVPLPLLLQEATQLQPTTGPL